MSSAAADGGAAIADDDDLDFWDVMTGSKPKRLRRASSAGSDHPPQAKAAKAKAKGKSRSKAPPKTEPRPRGTAKAKAQPQDLSYTCVSNAPCELLHEVYDQMKEHFPPDYDECVERAFNLMSEPGMTRFGTACSGTDQVSRVLQEYGDKTGGKFLQVWACEIVQWKRNFIEKNAIAPMPIFPDLITLASSCITGAVDSISQALTPVSSCDGLIVCCSCTTLSSLNQRDQTVAQVAVAEEKGATGSTIHGFLKLLSELPSPPSFFLMENVPKLIKGLYQAEDEEMAEFEQNGPALKNGGGKGVQDRMVPPLAQRPGYTPRAG